MIVYFEITNEDGYQVVGEVNTECLEDEDMVKYSLKYWEGVYTSDFPNYIPNCQMKTNFLKDVENGKFFDLIYKNRFNNTKFEMDGYNLKMGDQVIAPMECDFENYVIDDVKIDNYTYNMLEKIYDLCNIKGELPFKYFKPFYIHSLRIFCTLSGYVLLIMSSEKLLQIVAKNMAIELSQINYIDYFDVVMALLDGDYYKALEKANEL